jgi:predicted N-acetyltransferase YhbS
MKYENAHASLEVVPSKVVPGVMELTALKTEDGYEKQGFATDVMNEACKDADIGGHVLMLMATPDLKPFYERFAFTQIQKKPLLMARQPMKWTPTFTPISKAFYG